MYASMLPRGREAHFFGLELTLDLATGWVNPLVQSVIQNRTHNLRYPMLPNFFLLVIALCFYVWCDLEKGIKDSLKEFDEAAPAVDDGT
jgi:MFS-type transporter involved in bile tolerance (Atg22 family)